MIEGISAITLATHDMSRAVRLYRMLGFEIMHGGEDAAFTSFRAGNSYLNLIAQPARWPIAEGPGVLQHPTCRDQPCIVRQHDRPQPGHRIAEMIDVNDLGQIVRPICPAMRFILPRSARRRLAPR